MAMLSDTRVRELEHRLRGYPAEEVRSCYRYYKDDPLYRGTPEHVILERVYEEMRGGPRFGSNRSVSPLTLNRPRLEPLGEPIPEQIKPKKKLLLLL
jgi:hypothetical protein